VTDQEKEVLDQKTSDEAETDHQENVEKKEPKKKKKLSLEDKIELIEEELSNLKDKYYRTLAEAENVKKRAQEEVKRERKYASMTVCDKLIDQLEVFDQALSVETEDANFKNFLIGFKMIKDMIYASLESEGVSMIATTVGKEFDPTVEHAFDTRYDPDKPLNTVLEVKKKGYMFKDRLLRPALVTINIQPETETDSEQEPSASQPTGDTPVA
jgi:molecular chaperone GrpE